MIIVLLVINDANCTNINSSHL